MTKSMYELILYEEQFPTTETIEHICKKYESIKKYAIILHNKEDKKNHYHVALHFGRSFESSQLLTMFKINKNQIGKIKGRWKDIMLYLTHKNASNKLQYDNNNVISNFDYEEELHKLSRAEEVQDLIMKFSNLELVYFDLWKQLTPNERIKHWRKIEMASQIRNTNIKMEATRKMKVIYVKGKAGSGKTTFAKFYAEKILKSSFYITSSSNDALQDYMGQKIIIMDDLRGDSFKYHDLLKMLDNHTSTSVKSRFFNKAIDCDLIIITSVKDIFELYSKEIQEKDDYSQLLRRIGEFITIDNKGNFHSKKINIEKYTTNGKIEYKANKTLSISFEILRNVYKMEQQSETTVQEHLENWKLGGKKFT